MVSCNCASCNYVLHFRIILHSDWENVTLSLEEKKFLWILSSQKGINSDDGSSDTTATATATAATLQSSFYFFIYLCAYSAAQRSIIK
jgi:hypothetical protein